MTAGNSRMKPLAERGPGQRRLRQSLGSRRGNIAVIAAISFFPIVGAIGLGVDYTRLSLVRTEMQRGVDAAALAGARIINAEGNNSAEVTDDALMYFWANYRSSVADAAIVGGNPGVAILEPNRDAVRVTANAQVPMAFGNFLGLSSKTLQVEAQAQRAVAGMEVVMVLDNTGSMSQGTRMADLKVAAKDLVEILYGSKETKDIQNCPPGNPMAGCSVDYLLTVGIVPFNMVVNIGPASRLTKGNLKAIVDPKEVSKVSWGTGNGWKGCVFARGGLFETTRADATPEESPFLPYVWKNATSKSGMNPWGKSPESWPQDDLPPGLATKNFEEVGRGHGRGLGPNLACGQPITPLQPSKSVALEQIDGMDIGRDTGTVVPVGLAWGWRLLAPNWRPYWAGGKRAKFSQGKEIEVTTPADVPRDYNARNFEKVIVLFTDGMNVVHANDSPEACCTGPYGDPKTVRDTMGSKAAASALADTYTRDVCTAIKAKGIKIYVVLLYPSAPQTLLDLYNEKGCASGRNFFFHASTSTELKGIFNTVGTQLKNLRLVQ